MARPEGFCPVLPHYRLASLVATSAKMLPRSIFFRFAPSLFESLCLNITKKYNGTFRYRYIFWPAQRDSNPRSSESESAALSSCAMSGYLSKKQGDSSSRHPCFFFMKELFQAIPYRYPSHCKDLFSQSSELFCREVLHQGRY